MINKDFMPGFAYNSYMNMMQHCNTAADWSFYDTGALTQTEFEHLVKQDTKEGTILVVLPSGTKDMGVKKYNDHEDLTQAGGDQLQRFSIAGVGSSDVGAAALARNLADHYQEPVGAIVAGYGLSDIMSEALTGWFDFGKANRILEFAQEAHVQETKAQKADVNKIMRDSPDTKALYHLLSDAERSIKSISGHSKGCLSISLALEALVNSKPQNITKKAKKIDIITLGTVVEFPEGFDNVHQFIGNIDWFGGMNSRPRVEHKRVPNAWHHLNTTIPMHLDVKKVLAEYTF